MTIIPASRLTPHEIASLGNNLSATVRRDPEDVAAQNRSLAALGEELDSEIEAAIQSEHVAS